MSGRVCATLLFMEMAAGVCLLSAQVASLQAQAPGTNSEVALERQIDAALARGSGAEADERLDKLLDEPHPASDVLLRTGIAFAQKGLFPEAVRAFIRCVDDYPHLFEGHYNLALAELAQNHLPQALADIDAAPHESEEEATARIYLRGKIEAAMGRTEPAKQDLAAAFAQNQGQENYALDLGLLDLRTHAYPDAERVFSQASARDSRSTYLALGLALAKFLGGHSAQAMEALRRILASDPGISPARLLLAFALYMDGQFAEVRQVAGVGLKLPDPDPYLSYLDAVTMMKQHDQDHMQILRELAAAEKGAPDCALCYVASGKVHEGDAAFPEALADLQKAIGLAPDLSEGWYHLAVVYGRLGQPAEAAKARAHFQALKTSADEDEKEMMRRVLLQSLGGGR